MPSREEAIAELALVFDMISDEYRVKGIAPPKDTLVEVASA